MRQFAKCALPVAAAVVTGAAVAAAGPGGTAAAAPQAQDTVLTMHAGGDRSGTTGATVPGGPAGVVFTVENASGTQVGTCTTVAGGTCTVNVTNGQTYTVTQSAVPPPAGWFSSANLGVGTSTTPTAQNYSQVTVNVPTNATTISVPPTGATGSTTTNNANNTLRSGTWAVSRDNPPEPANCGLDVALLFDLSGSVQPYLAQYKAAGEAFVRAFENTPSRVALFTSGTDAPAAGNPNFPLTPVTTAAQAAPLLTQISNLSADGGTNWDRGIWQIAASAQHYDVAVVLTDGNPAYSGTGPSGPGNRTRFAEVENGIFSANALKLKGTRIIAVGIGAFESLTGSVDNLKAISGKTPGSDFITTSFANLGQALKSLALTNCAGIKIEKSAVIKNPATDRYDRIGQQVHRTYTVTNTGKFFTLNNVAVTDDRIHGPIHCDAATLAPGEHTTCTDVYTIIQADLDAGHVTNVASAAGTATNGTPVLSDEVDTTFRAHQRLAISIVKTASVHSFAAAGLLITYFYRVTNTGNVTLIATARDQNASPLVCPLLVLPPGRSMTCRSYHVVTAADVAAGHISNVAIARGKAPDGTVVHAAGPMNIPEVRAPAISIFKLASAFTFATAGTPVTYYYLVVNSGNATLDPVTVADSRGLPVSCPQAALDPNEEMTCTAHYVTTQADVDRGTIANTGTVTGRVPDGAEVTDNASVAIPAMPAPALSIVKTASPVTFSAAGQLITYSYLVTNNGNVSLRGVTVTDSRGLALSCPSTSLAAGQAMTCTARYRTTQADVSAGPIVNIALVQGTTPNGAALGDASVAFVFPTVFFFPVTG